MLWVTEAAAAIRGGNCTGTENGYLGGKEWNGEDKNGAVPFLAAALLLSCLSKGKLAEVGGAW